MDQRIAAGIGNVYKSEVLFECRVHPRTNMQHITADRVRELYERAAALMRLNLLTRRRTAVPLRRRPTPSSQRLWVYGRAGRPCLDCGTTIERFMQGDMNRSTYFCPACQPPSLGATRGTHLHSRQAAAQNQSTTSEPRSPHDHSDDDQST
jgi:endonuclease-8